MTLPPFVSDLQQRWAALQQREKRILAGGGLFLLGFAFYAGLWVPMQSGLDRLRASVPAKTQELARLQMQATEIRRLKGRGPTKPSGSSLSTVERLATSRGLRQQISKLEPDGQHGLRLTVEQVDFNRLLRFLAELQKQQGLRVENATFDGDPDSPGIVTARLILRGAG